MRCSNQMPFMLTECLQIQFGSLPKIGIAVLCWIYTVDMQAAAEGWDWSSTGWVAKVVLRDLFLMVVIAGVWDWILYFSPLKARLAPFKFNSEYPKPSQLMRDVFWTLSATLLASAQVRSSIPAPLRYR